MISRPLYALEAANTVGLLVARYLDSPTSFRGDKLTRVASCKICISFRGDKLNRVASCKIFTSFKGDKLTRVASCKITMPYVQASETASDLEVTVAILCVALLGNQY